MKIISQDELVYIDEDLHNLTIIDEIYDSEDNSYNPYFEYEYNLYYNDKDIGSFNSFDACKKVRDEIISLNNNYRHLSNVYKVPNR